MARVLFYITIGILPLIAGLDEILTLYLALYVSGRTGFLLPLLSTSSYRFGFANSSDTSSRARKSRKKPNTMCQALPKPQTRPALRSLVLAMKQALGPLQA